MFHSSAAVDYEENNAFVGNKDGPRDFKEATQSHQFRI